MAALSIILLIMAIAGVAVRPVQLASWMIPLGCALLSVMLDVSSSTTSAGTTDFLRHLALPAIDPGVTPALWAVLIGVNVGPVVLVTGSLASLLWLDALNRLDVTVRPRDFTVVGVRVGLPAAIAGAASFLFLNAIG